MPNPAGTNQFQGFGVEPPYGDVAKQTQLTREAPISGAPFSGSALNTPRRAGRQAKRPSKAQLAQLAQAVQAQAPGQEMQVPPETALAFQWRDIASVPGASPLVQQIAQQAQEAVGG